MNTPVLFLVFNRPSTTKKVFEKIKKAKPPRLYISADGPRAERLKEREMCEEVRKIATRVDWNCEVKTLFRENNLGCKIAVSSAIDWFFENENKGIILEDDCVPNESFFKFCDILLRRYKDDERIMHINGNNYGLSLESHNCSYGFCNFPQVWGWATWRRAWEKYEANLDSWSYFKNKQLIRNLPLNIAEAEIQLNKWENVYQEKIDTWDHQWHYSVLSQSGLVIYPKYNLISNIGHGPNATHTKTVNSKKSSLKTFEMRFPLKHPNFILADKCINKYYKKRIITRGYNHIFRNAVKFLIRKIRNV